MNDRKPATFMTDWMYKMLLIDDFRQDAGGKRERLMGNMENINVYIKTEGTYLHWQPLRICVL